MTRLEFALRQIEIARRDTLTFLEDLEDADWFGQPFAGANHIAWQVGHLTIAEIGLTMGEVLGRRAQELGWIDDGFRSLFKRGSEPSADPGQYPTPRELQDTMSSVHERVLGQLQDLPDDRLDEPTVFGHPLAATKLDALHLCARHEALHTGQIAMLRRACGWEPIR